METIENLKAAVKYNVPMVIGTTGFSKEQFVEIRKASHRIPIVLSGNMSLGVNILFKLTSILSKIAPDTYSAKIIESHHVHKKDKPSGTAKMLEENIRLENTVEILKANSLAKKRNIQDIESN